MNTKISGETVRKMVLRGEPLPADLTVGGSLILSGCTALTPRALTLAEAQETPNAN